MAFPRLRRLTHIAVTAVAPEVGGRWATDVFSWTRAYGARPDPVLPLGARGFEVTGSTDVPRGYLWGDSGRGVALLVHGWGSDSSSMHSLIAPLRDAGFAVAAFDAPSHGVWDGEQATMTQYTDAVAAVMRTLGEVRVIVSHSLGAIAAVGGAAKAGQSLAGVVMIAPTCTLSGVLGRWSPADMRVSPSVVERIYRELHFRNKVPVSHWDVVSLGAGIGCPILAIHDPDDEVIPYSEAEAIAIGLPDVRLLQAPGRGHFGILMAPEVKAAVSAFIAEHEMRPSEAVA